MQINGLNRLTTDVLIIGGGTAGCYAALTIREKSDASIIIAEKANIKRSGCLAAGVNAIFDTERREGTAESQRIMLNMQRKMLTIL